MLNVFRRIRPGAVIGDGFLRLCATTATGEYRAWFGGMQLAALAFTLKMLATLSIAVLQLVFSK
jgi:hypothetical protein